MRGMIQRVAFIGRWYLDLDDFADPLALTWIPLVLGKRTAHLRSVRSTRSCCLFEPCASTSDAFQRIEVLDISADSTFVRSLQNFPALAALTIHITTIRDPDAATEWPPLLHLTRLRLTNDVVLKLSMKSRKGCRKHEWTRSILNLRIGACGCFSQSLANQKLNCSRAGWFDELLDGSRSTTNPSGRDRQVATDRGVSAPLRPHPLPASWWIQLLLLLARVVLHFAVTLLRFLRGSFFTSQLHFYVALTLAMGNTPA